VTLRRRFPQQRLRERPSTPGFALDDIDVFEVNEAFAAQALAVCRVVESRSGVVA
jgi:acetyl-CoA acetyltransferase